MTAAQYSDRPLRVHAHYSRLYTVSLSETVNDSVSDRVRDALAVSLRGCEELLPQADWLRTLARSEARRGFPPHHATGADVGAGPALMTNLRCVPED